MTVDAEIPGKTHSMDLMETKWEFNDQGNADISTIWGYLGFRKNHILELSNTSSIDQYPIMFRTK